MPGRSPPSDSRTPSRTRFTGVPSYSSTPASIAARRSARTSSPGWTVAPSGKKTPSRKTGEDTRRARSSRDSATAWSGRPTAAAASTACTTAASCAGAADTRNIPLSRSQTSSPRDSANARTAGTICSPASASRTAAVSPSTRRSDASAAQ